MQKIELYYDAFEAKCDMDKHIERGWRVHACTMGCFMAGYSSKEKVLVVYEK